MPAQCFNARGGYSSMLNSISSSRLFTLLLITSAAILSRFLPHPPNFTALNAVCLFGAYTFGSLSFTLTSLFLTLFFSDCLIGFYSTLFSVYTSFGLIALMGYYFSLRYSIRGLIIATPLASLLFYLITNFTSWLNNPMYPKTLTGLGLSYFAGLPFLGFQFAGDLFYVTLLFGLFSLYQKPSSLSSSYYPYAP